MATRTWNGVSDSFTNGADWSPNGVPQPGDIAIIASGTVLANSYTLAGLTVDVNSGASIFGTLRLADSTNAAGSIVTLNNPNAYGTGTAPTLAIQGRTVNAGTINLAGTVSTVTFASTSASDPGLLVNTGTIAIIGGSPNVNTAGASATLENDGAINITNTANNYQSPVFNIPIVGTGTINLGALGKIDLRQGTSAGQTVNYSGGANGFSVVQIENPSSFKGTITNFVAGNYILVANTQYDSATYTSNSAGTGGSLNLFYQGNAEGSLNFTGLYSLNSLSLTFQSLGNGYSNLTIGTSVTNPSSGSSTPSTASAPVYRFFDTKFGTHLFTQSNAEAQQILATRPDLTQETNNFGAVSSSNPSAEPVYRFFEQGNGTHFYTSSQAEFVALTTPGNAGYRSDFTYEPTSSIYEDSAQQAGDVAVYRLFDSVHGTQFLTGSQSEYQGLTTAGSGSYRPDLSPEGIAFYAPAGTFHT